MHAIAFVNWGNWVAKCPRCPTVERAGRDPLTGYVGGLTGSSFRCSLCGLVCEAVWPPSVDDITRLLNLRPSPTSRNWAPPEDIHDLQAENLMHGILPATPEVMAAHQGPLLEIVGHRITAASVALPAPGLPEIEGRR